MNCFLYCRKSSEDKSRQVQSVGDQKKILREIARNRGLKIREIFVDEKSAGKPYQRPFFLEMMKRIHSGEASIVLSWKIDRLSRNPIENGQISWMLQNGIISEIIVSDRSYLPQDNVLLLMLEGAMANQYLRDLSTNVKRGMKSYVERGVFPGIAPIGYLNHGHQKGNKTIISDPQYFPVVKKLWKLLLTGNYQLADLYRLMEKKYPIYRKGKSLSFASFYSIFHNPFYCGLFKWSGQRHLGIQEKMITQSEFDIVQNFLNKKNKTRERNFVFDFKGIFNCGTCSASITAERKTKFIITTQCEKSFDYYRCAHRKRAIQCREKPLSKKQIIDQLQEHLVKLSLPEKIIDFGIKKLSDSKKIETELQTANLLNIKKEIQCLKRKKEQIENNLVLETDSDIRSLMKQKYGEVKIKIQKIYEDYDTTLKSIENWNQQIIENLETLKNAQFVIESGTKEMKHNLLNHLGSNWEIKGKKIDFKPYFVCEAIMRTKDFIRAKKSVIEPTKTLFETDKPLASNEVSLIWSTLFEFIKNSQNKNLLLK